MAIANGAIMYIIHCAYKPNRYNLVSGGGGAMKIPYSWDFFHTIAK